MNAMNNVKFSRDQSSNVQKIQKSTNIDPKTLLPGAYQNRHRRTEQQEPFETTSTPSNTNLPNTGIPRLSGSDISDSEDIKSIEESPDNIIKFEGGKKNRYMYSM